MSSSSVRSATSYKRPDTPNLPLEGGLEGHGTVDSERFPGLNVDPQHVVGPSWSVRRLAAPHSVGPAIFLGSPPTLNTPSVLLECAAHGRSSQCGTRGFVFSPGSPPTLNTPLVPPGVCGAWPLLAVWDPRFPRAHRQPHTLKNYS